METIRLGITNFLANPRQYVQDARIGFVGNYNAVDEGGYPVIARLHEHPDIDLRVIYTPEHGLWAAAQAGIRLHSEIDDHTGVKVISLYGDKFKPTSEMLADIDVLLVDARDGGCRYTTGSSTMSLCIEAAAENNLPIIVTDRPNPLGGEVVEGNVLDSRYQSFVGFHSIAIRHGLTAGELALMFNSERQIEADLTIVELEGWQRNKLYPSTGLLWVSSPNMVDFLTAVVYPGTCLFEGTNISEGRGTTKPFRLIGSPWLDEFSLACELNKRNIGGVRFRPARFIPKFSKYADEVCRGVEVHVVDTNSVESVRLGIEMIYAVRNQAADKFQWFGFEELTSKDRLFIDLLAGGEFRHSLEKGETPEQILEFWAKEGSQFKERRKSYLIY